MLILSMHDNEEFFFEAIRAGAAGYVLKTGAEQDLADACRAAVRGEPFLYPGAIGAPIRDYLARAPGERDLPADQLTPRETEVVKLIAEGHTSREIAAVLSISRAHGRAPPGQRARQAAPQGPGRADPLRDPARPCRAVTTTPPAPGEGCGAGVTS